MAKDNADFKRRLQEARQRKEKVDALRLAVIQWQVLVEEALEGFLTASLFNPQHIKIERMNFHPKGKLALALARDSDRDPLWDLFWAIQELRNEIAHNLDSKEIDNRMRYLREKYISCLEASQKADGEKKKNPEVVEEAAILVMGLLSQLTMQAKERRAIIDDHEG